MAPDTPSARSAPATPGHCSISRSGNLFANIPAVLPSELVEVLAHDGNVRIERIVSLGHATPANECYDQDTHEWVVLLTGRAELRLEDPAELVLLAPGDHVHIPAHRRHRVEWTDPAQPTVWLAVHYR